MNIRILAILFVFLSSCKEAKKAELPNPVTTNSTSIEYAKGFTIEKQSNGITVMNISSPWPNAKTGFKYALVPKDKMASISLNKNEFDAIIGTPINSMVATSTTHIPALEALGEIKKLTGFPDTQYISSKKARNRIDEGKIKELGNNESINTEMVIELQPEVVIGFSINSQNKAYETLMRSNIPVVYNGDWTEETPLGKAEWIKFFAPFFQKEQLADSIFKEISNSYNQAKSLAKKAKNRPTVLSGALYKDVWYLPGGNSWAAKFIEDANTEYPWSDNEQTGSLNMSIESVLAEGHDTDFWISPSQFISYEEMKNANVHYLKFKAFQNKNIYTFANTKGDTGGLLYYELAPNRPDWVLKDLIHIFHPELLPDHELFFFKPLN
ncbi:ABC transporter substrate-binding protein [Maribacter sp. HTCC2170]|uniref:ABC transporter substrate-binding protein n=1 Tax=Maribacter sp. (strain HTCC2170 / KCCM 42371) TaxID=313603 RepID=UPI00006B480F|nr:ABC transporter substrate-binding protein [Maribacter sp. HTCC2170]EAR01605.1 periplasmic-binding protein of ABC transporter [Maribacter sp. HTCC2170]